MEKEILEKLKSEIKDLENQKKQLEKENIKIKGKRNLKISLKFLRRIAPYTLVFSLATPPYIATLNHPDLELNQTKFYETTMSTIDNQGNKETKKQYGDFEDQKNKLNYYTKWSKKDEENYTRSIKTYSLDEIEQETINKIINNEEQIDNNKLINETIETKNNLTDKEINQEEIIEAITYSTNNENYIYKTNPNYQIYATYFYIIIVLSLIGPIAYLRKYNYNYEVKKIKEETKFHDVKHLDKKIKIKKDNYQRIAD